jgi:hypothetical protein
MAFMQTMAPNMRCNDDSRSRYDESHITEGALMPISDAVATIKRDPKWKSKIGIGLLVNLVPYVGMFALRGWLLDHQRAVAWGAADGLPEWGDWTERAKNGLFGMLPGLLYSTVVSVVLSVPFTLILIFAIGLLAGFSGGSGPDVLVPMALSWLGTMAFIIVLSVPMLPFVYVPEAGYALFRDLSLALRLKTTWRQIRAGGPLLRRAWGFGAAYITLVILAIELPLLPVMAAPMLADTLGPGPVFALMAFSLVVWLVVYLIVLVIAVPASLVQAHLWAEWARKEYALEELPAYSK